MQLLVHFLAAAAAVASMTYKNPVWPDYFADPAVRKFNDQYYAYGSAPAVKGKEFPVLRSKDLVHWHLLGGALEPFEGCRQNRLLGA